MPEVPRIVRERLRSQAGVGAHPDANLLSAFVERALTEEERAQVLDHLSRCDECREMAALTIPEIEQQRLVAAAAASARAGRSWWRSPFVHWGALTAAALVVLIAVATRMQLRQGHSASAPAVAKYEPAEQQIASAPATAPAPPEPKESQKLAETARAPRPAATFQGPKPMAVVSGEKVAAVGGPVQNVATENLPALPAPAPVMKARASASVDKTAGAGLENAFGQAQVKGIPAPPAAATDSAAVTASQVAAPKREAAALSPRSDAVFAKRAYLSPRWSISDSGNVQRSLDGGRSWKDVAVADGVTFRAVATVGNDVWAGGLSGALFHSADGGERWSRVQVQANGRALSGDIVRIEFADIRNGVVTTSAGETWTTSDSGATWRGQ